MDRIVAPPAGGTPRWLWIATLVGLALSWACGSPEIPEGPPIEGFQQLMERGGIPALYDPQFVSAGEAEIPDDAWVLGLELDGNAYAYDLNTLNHHEVVNHEAGDVPVAAVW